MSKRKKLLAAALFVALWGALWALVALSGAGHVYVVRDVFVTTLIAGAGTCALAGGFD